MKFAKTMMVGDILTQAEMKKALKLYNSAENHTFADRCASEIIGPVLDRINKASGQENDPKYLAYCVEFAIRKARGKLHG